MSASNLFITKQHSIVDVHNNDESQTQTQRQFQIKPRVGTVFPSQTRELKTPNFILGSVRGSTPHMTPDLVQTLPQYNALQVSIGEVHTLHPALQQYQQATQSKRPYHDMLVLPKNHCVALGLRNPTTDLMYVNKRYNPSPGQLEAEAQFPYPLSAKIAATRSETGAVRLTPQEFWEKSLVFTPDFLLLGGQDSDIDETKSRAEKTMRRNLEWVDQIYLAMSGAEKSQTETNQGPERLFRRHTDLTQNENSKQELSLSRPLLVAPLEGGSHLDKRTRNGGVVSRKGTPSWQHAEAPVRTDFENDEDFKAASKVYQDKITNDGLTVDVLPDAYHIGGLGTAVSTQQRREMIAASMGYAGPNDLAAKIPSRMRMTTATGEPAELIDLVENGIDLVSVTYPQVLTEEGLAMKIPITIEALRKALGLTENDGHEANAGRLPVCELSQNDKLHEFNIMNLRDERYVEDPLPIDPDCVCYACKHHSRSYLNHLLNTREMLAEVLLMLHNTHQYSLLFQNMRDLIEIDTRGAEEGVGGEKGEVVVSQFAHWADLARKVYVPHGEILHRNARNRSYTHHDPNKLQQKEVE